MRRDAAESVGSSCTRRSAVLMKWISVKDELPRKDIPILVVTKFCEMPDCVRWLEEGTYGEPGFFESNDEYETKEESILFWMPAPELPNKVIPIQTSN